VFVCLPAQKKAHRAAGKLTNTASAYTQSATNLGALACSGELMSPSDAKKLAAIKICANSSKRQNTNTVKHAAIRFKLL